MTQQVKFKALQFNVKIRLLANLLKRFSNELTIPFMTIYLSAHLGVFAAGMIICVILSSGIIFSMLGGVLADYCQRKKVLVFSESLHMVSILLMVCGMFYANYVVLVIGYFLKNLFVTIATAASEAIIIDSSTKVDRELIYTLNYWISSGSIILGSGLGALLYKDYFIWVMLFTALIGFIVFLIYLLLKIPEGECGQRETAQLSIAEFKQYKIVCLDQKFSFFLLSSLFLSALLFVFPNYLSVYLTHTFELTVLPMLGAITGTELFAMLRVENMLLVVMVTPLLFTSASIKKLSEKISLTAAHMIYIIPFTAMSYFMNPYMLIGCVFIYTLGEILIAPRRNVIMANLIPEKNRGKYLSAYHLSVRGGNILASMILSASAYLPSVAITLIIAICGLLSLLFLNQVNKSP